jgi:hypothetical protein
MGGSLLGRLRLAASFAPQVVQDWSRALSLSRASVHPIKPDNWLFAISLGWLAFDPVSAGVVLRRWVPGCGRIGAGGEINRALVRYWRGRH